MSMIVQPAFSGPGRTTYQAKIIKPNGYPLEASSVNFQFTILDPAGSCILYSESYSAISMAGTGGLISFSLGTGLKSFPLNATTFEQVFSNSTPSLLCAAGGPASYNPLATDTRKVVMQFNDGGGWQTLPAMNINAVPYALYANEAERLQGLSATDFVRISNLATCTASQALHFNGGGFSCVPLATNSGPVSYTVTSNDVTTALGYVPTSVTSYTAVVNTVSSLSNSATTLTTAVSSLSNTIANLGDLAFSNSLDLGSASATGIISDARLLNQALVVSGAQYSKVTVDGKGRVISGSQITASDINSTLAMPSCGINQYLTFNGTSYSCAADSGASGTIASVATTGPLSATAGSNPVLSLNYSTDFTVSSNALTLMTTGVVPGTYVKMTVDNKGRVVSSSALTLSDITTALGYVPVSSTTLSSYVVRSNNLSDLSDFAAARNNLGLGGFALVSSLDLSSASATGILSDARLANQTGVVSGSAYTKIYVDGKGRVVSGASLTQADVVSALGFTPLQSGSVVSSQWLTSGTALSYSSGYVGIGTANPTSDLEIKGTLAALTLTRSINSAASPDLYLQKDRGVSSPVVAGDTIGHISFRGLTGGTSYTRGARISAFVTSAPQQGYIGADLRFYTNDSGLDTTERMRITASGAVGIGAFSPNAQLEVSGTIRADQICDRTGNNCQIISNGWASGGSSSATAAVSITAVSPLQVTGASATPQLSLMTNGSVSGQTLRFDGSTWQRTKLLYTDLVNSAAASPWPVSTCSSGQAIIWNSATDSFVCSTIQISAAQLPQTNLASSASGGVTGILPVAFGGTGQSSFTANTFLVGNGTSALSAFAMGASGAVLRSNGAGVAPSWTTLDTLLQAVNNSMISNWPDALYCNDGSEFSVLHIDTREAASNRIWYSKASASHNIQFVATTGAYASSTGFTGNSVCINKSISTLMTEGRYFNVAKGPVGQWLSNGTTNYYNAGSVVIGAASAATSAVFEVSSTTKGFLPPRLTTAQRDAIVSAANGLMIYNSSLAKYQFYDGSSWTDLGSGASGSTSGTGTISSRQYFTSNGTFTVPAGVTRIRVTVAGGGGGGGDYTATNGNDGGSSSFGGTIIAGGGLGGARGDYGLDRNGNLHGGGSGGNITIIGGGAAGGPGRPTWQSNSDPIDATGQTGGNGGLTISDINVTPGASFAVVVGSGGSTSGGSPGASGYVHVEWGGSGGGSTFTSVDLGSASATGILSPARLPAFTGGDITSVSGSTNLTLANTGVVAGTYDKVTVDSKGRVTSGSVMTAADITSALGFTPMNAVSGSLGGAIAWVSFNNTGVITSSFNILSVSKTTTGRYVVNFRYNLPDTNYAVITGAVNTGNGDGAWSAVDSGFGNGKSVSGVRIVNWGYNGGLMDYPETYVAIYHGSGTSPLAYGFSENGSNIYRMTGNFGLGTSSPASALEVSGTIRADRICDRTGNNCQTISSGWAASGATGSGTTMLNNWPDAIRCRNNSNSIDYILYLAGDYDSSFRKYYATSRTGTGDQNWMIYDTNGSYYGNLSMGGGFDCVTSAMSITQLYAANQAFRFVGGSSSVSSSATSLGSWTSRSADINYQAATDGFVVVNPSSCAYGYYSVYSDAASAPTTERMKGKAYATGGSQAGAMIPVRKNDYWRVSTTYSCAPDAVWWVSLDGGGAGGSSVSATATTSGYLTSADWLTFNSKLSTLDLGSVSATGTLSPLRLPAFNGDVISTVASSTLSVVGIRGISVSSTAPVSGQVLSYNGSQWVPQMIDQLLGGSNNSMVSNWPDAILCNNFAGTSGNKRVYVLKGVDIPSGQTYYSMPGETDYYIYFTTATGAYAGRLGGTDDCTSQSMTQIKNAGKSFNFAKGPVGQWLASGTSTYINTGNVGIGTATPQATLDVSGAIRMSASVATCNSSIEGTQRYNSTSKVMEFCNGTSWLKIGSQNSRKYARVATSGSLTSGAGAINMISWASAVEDTSSFWSAGAPSRITIPSGVTRVKLCASVVVNSGSTITMNYFQVLKNGGDFSGAVHVSSDAADNNWGGYACTPAITVTTGDYFEVRYYSRDAAVTFNGNRTWFTVEEQ